MIRKIIVRNFQRHKHLSLKLDPKVTTIVGPSDTGKSALLRALRWVCLNQPSGAKFIRKGAEEASVLLLVDDHKIKRSRGKRNIYTLDGRKFAAFGKDVPEEISSILNVSQLNFQKQIDGPYWFTLSPSEVSRQLNTIVDLSLIDSTLSNLASSSRRARMEREVVRKRLVAARKERRSFTGITQADQILRRVEALEAQTTTTGLRAAALRDLLQIGRKHEEHESTLRLELLGAQSVAKAGVSWEKLHKETTNLQALVEEGRRLEKLVDQKIPKLEKLEKLAARVQKLAAKSKQLSLLLSEAHSLSRKLSTCSEELQESEQVLRDTMGETCALCDRPL